jgi:hypothetical protein
MSSSSTGMLPPEVVLPMPLRITEKISEVVPASHPITILLVQDLLQAAVPASYLINTIMPQVVLLV